MYKSIFRAVCREILAAAQSIKVETVSIMKSWVSGIEMLRKKDRHYFSWFESSFPTKINRQVGSRKANRNKKLPIA